MSADIIKLSERGRPYRPRAVDPYAREYDRFAEERRALLSELFAPQAERPCDSGDGDAA